MKSSLKYLEDKKWKLFDMKECAGKSIVNIMSKESRVCVAALLDDDNKPTFFLTNDDEQFNIYKNRGYAMMLDDMILLLGEETLPATPVTEKALELFPDCKFEAKEKLNKLE